MLNDGIGILIDETFFLLNLFITPGNFESSRLYCDVSNDFFSFKLSNSELIGFNSPLRLASSILLVSIFNVFSWNFPSSSATLVVISLSVITCSPVLVKTDPS